MSVGPMPGTLWSDVLSRVQDRISDQQFETWFRGVELRTCTEELIEIATPNSFAGEWLQKRYREVILAAAREVFGGREPELRLTSSRAQGSDSSINLGEVTARPESAARSAPEEETASRAVADLLARVQREAGGRGTSPSRPSATLAAKPAFRQVLLSPRYRLDNFVASPTSRVAVAAAQSMVQGQGHRYSPIYIHAGTGLGKTHLLQAIAQGLRLENPALRVRYVPCEHFVNHFIAAVDQGKVEAFRAFYREVDVLLMDDVHLLAGKDRTQQEFEQTFEELHRNQARIVVASNRPPQELEGLTDKLVNLFQWGLLAPLTLPLCDQRAELARRFAAELEVELSGAVTDAVAEGVATNVRELEGVVVRLVGRRLLAQVEPSVELVQDLLRDLKVGQVKKIPLPTISESTARFFRVDLGEMLGPKRGQAISRVRQIAMWLCRRLTEHSSDEIGKHFGGRDHSTVLYGVESTEARLAADPELRSRVDRLHSELAIPKRG